MLDEQLRGPAWWNAQVDRTPDGAALLAEAAAAAVDAVVGERLTPERLLAALAHAVDFARYWQEPDGVDHALARPAVRAALVPLAARVVAAGPGWWTAPCVPQAQWLVEWDGTGASTGVPDDALARWRRDTLDDEERAVERPADVRASWSGI